MTLSSRFALPGQVRAVATSDPSGPLTVTGYGANPLVTVITRVDLSGKVPGVRSRPRHRRRPTRLTSCASVRQPVQLVRQGFGDGTDAAV